jgi:adenosine/AMP kinase
LFHYWRREIASRDREVGTATRASSAGLIAVEIVDETSVRSMTTAMLEIECPGGAVIRLREEVSVDVLQRVIRACQQVQTEGASASVPVRSC